MDPTTVELIVRMAKDNPRWGYLRIKGELAKLGVVVSATCHARLRGLPCDAWIPLSLDITGNDLTIVTAIIAIGGAFVVTLLVRSLSKKSKAAAS